MNINPMSAVVTVREGVDLLVIDEIVIYGSNTDELVSELLARGYAPGTTIIYPDPAAKQRKTSAGGRTDLSILQNAGFEVKVKHAHPAIRDRINAVNSRLKSNSGRHLFVDPRCKQTIQSLERQVYKEGTSQPDKDAGFDHMNDALGYLVEFLYPVVRDYKPQPARWS